MTPQVYIAGQPVAALAKVGSLVIAAEWPDAGIGGPASATFEVQLAPQDRPSWLVKDALAEVRIGGCSTLAGMVAEVDWDTGSVTINGSSREGETTVCLDATQAKTSSIPDEFIDSAIARVAVTWTRPASISATALAGGGQTGEVNSVVSALAAYADESGSRLYVDPFRRLLKGTDPVTPTYYLQPGSGELAWTSQEQATRVYGGWHDFSGAPHVTAVGSGATEQKVNLDPLGPFVDATRPTAILTSILAKATAGGWVGGITISAEQIFGRPHLADVLNSVGAGCMFRLLGQRDPRPGRVPVGFVDFVCDRAEWNVNDGTLLISPRGMAAEGWDAILGEEGVEAA